MGALRVGGCAGMVELVFVLVVGEFACLALILGGLTFCLGCR